MGHALTASHLRAEQRHAIEAALWAALRALEESGSLYRRMAMRARTGKQHVSMEIYEERATTAENSAKTHRDFLVHVNSDDVGGGGNWRNDLTAS